MSRTPFAMIFSWHLDSKDCDHNQKKLIECPCGGESFCIHQYPEFQYLQIYIPYSLSNHLKWSNLMKLYLWQKWR